MRAYILFAVIFCSLILNLSAQVKNMTLIEEFMEKKGVVVQITGRKLGEIITLDNKKLEFSSVILNEKVANAIARGVEITFYKSKYSDNFRASYIDYDELPGLISNLKEIWNFTSEAKEDEMSGVFVRTNSGFTIGLVEPAESDIKELKKDYLSSTYYRYEESENIEVKRMVFVATGEAIEEAKTLGDYDDIMRLNGFVILSLESIKDIIMILEKLTKE